MCKHIQICSKRLHLQGNSLVHFVTIFFLTFFALYIVSPGTSPSNPYLGIDTSVYVTMGTALSDGYLPYRDFFDHKGPLLYYIYAIAQYDVIGKLGIFVLQTIVWSISIYSIWRTLRLFVRRALSIVLILVFLACSFSLFCEGGGTEEWSLPVSCFLLYVVLDRLRFKEPVSRFPIWIWISLGAGIACHSMLRVTNAGVTCGEVLSLLLLMATEKSWKKMLVSSMYMLLGFLIVIFPIILHFWFEDSVKDLWYGLYVFNQKYALTALSGISVLKICIKTIPAIIVILLCSLSASVSQFLGKIKIVIYSITICTIISLFPGYAFEHYFLNFTPVICLALITFAKWIECSFIIEKKKKYLVYSVIFVFIMLPYLTGVKQNIMHGIICALMPGHPVEEYNRYITVLGFSKLIKTTDECKVLALDCPAQVYCYLGIKPCNRFFFLQSFLAKADSKIKEQVTNCFFNDETAPSWLIVPKEGVDEHQAINKIDKDFAAIINNNYYYVDSGPLREGRSDKSYALYRKK